MGSLRREERQVLTACTLVCKSWLPLAQRLLYRSVTVEIDFFRSPGTLNPEALLQRPHLLGFTRSLSIIVRGKTPTLPLFSENNSPKGGLKNIQIPAFFFLLAHTPRLRYLKLDGEQLEIANIERHILDWLSSLVLPIEVLDISKGGPFRSTFVYDLVGIWPTIRALRTFGRFGPPAGRASIRLRELRFAYSNDAVATATIEWLLPPPPPNEQSILRFLELYGTIPEEARTFLSVHGPSVSTLTLGCPPSFEFAHLFTKLEELVIVGPIWTKSLSTFPRTLKHIRLQPHAKWSEVFMHFSRPFVATIAQELHMLPDLRLISIEKEFAVSEHYPDLQKACETHKVEILVSSSDSSGISVVSACQRSQRQLSAMSTIH